MIRWSLSQSLFKEGYEVFTVEDGRKAIEVCKEKEFDFIITDLVMPELDGWEFLEGIKKIQASTRVIIITGHGKEDTMRMAKEKGAWAYIEKPYVIERIKDLLKKTN